MSCASRTVYSNPIQPRAASFAPHESSASFRYKPAYQYSGATEDDGATGNTTAAPASGADATRQRGNDFTLLNRSKSDQESANHPRGASETTRGLLRGAVANDGKEPDIYRSTVHHSKVDREGKPKEFLAAVQGVSPGHDAAVLDGLRYRRILEPGERCESVNDMQKPRRAMVVYSATGGLGIFPENQLIEPDQLTLCHVNNADRKTYPAFAHHNPGSINSPFY